jgi:hypothetical protein
LLLFSPRRGWALCLCGGEHLHHNSEPRAEPGWFLVHVPEIDQWTQARSEAEIEPMARDLVAVYLDVALDEVDIRRG